ncbi:MAG: S8 family serine peptidase [Proteobacteria bacterium]|nr:S8 family serine peptidase [Pseudomonadota bacterium]
MNKLSEPACLLIVSLATCFSLLISAPASAGQDTYILLYKSNSVPSSAAAALSAAGGKLVWSYREIGVAIAQSSDANFAVKARKLADVQGAAATSGLGMKVDGGGLAIAAALDASAADPIAGAPAAGDDNLSALQWDMAQISAPQARAVNGGSPSVLVGDIDTGLDYTHPDLAPNVDFANSVSCLGGVPNQDPAAWNDDNGHGTHTAGTIAAARNGIGIVGIAPNVRIAAIKAGNADGFFFPEAVVCAFMWAGSHHIQVTNNSYFADPWLFNCRNDAGQRALWEAERRAIRYAMQNGTVVVAAEGNEADDLAHPTQDVTSPDNSTPITREITNACAVVPTEISGVIGVTANGNKMLKSFYSSYGVGSVQVIAPGGDSILQLTAAAPNGRVLSTYPAALIGGCARKVFDGAATYCYLQGTSMASPHVAGVAALIASTGVTSPGAIAAKVSNTADPQPCPADVSIYAFFPSVSNGAPQVCDGGPGYNSFNGHGQVNALAAVSK